MRRSISLCALILLAIVSVVGLSPEGQVALTSGCEPDGKLASFRSSVQGRLFWRRQLRQIDDETTWWIKELPALRSEARVLSEKASRESQAIMNDFYAKQPALRRHPTEAEQSAEALRAQADAIERTEFDSQVDSMMAKRLAQLQRCRPIVQSRAH